MSKGRCLRILSSLHFCLGLEVVSLSWCCTAVLQFFDRRMTGGRCPGQADPLQATGSQVSRANTNVEYLSNSQNIYFELFCQEADCDHADLRYAVACDACYACNGSVRYALKNAQPRVKQSIAKVEAFHLKLGRNRLTILGAVEVHGVHGSTWKYIRRIPPKGSRGNPWHILAFSSLGDIFTWDLCECTSTCDFASLLPRSSIFFFLSL